MNHALWQLVLARFREFFRRPSTVFWVYGFPLLLSGVLGVAFKNRPVEQVAVGVCTDADAGAEGAKEVQRKLERDPRLIVSVGTDRQCRDRLRTGRIGLVVIPTAESGRYK